MFTGGLGRIALDGSKPGQVPTYEQFIHDSMMGVFHRDARRLKSGEPRQRKNFVRQIIGHQKVSPHLTNLEVATVAGAVLAFVLASTRRLVPASQLNRCVSAY